MATRKNNVDVDAMRERIRGLMTEKGMTHQNVESAIGAGRGYMSKILGGHRGDHINPDFLASIASVLGVSANFLRYGEDLDPKSALTHSAGLSPRLEELPGYQSSAFEVYRREPSIPYSIMEQAAGSRILGAPAKVTPDWLQAFVKFLAAPTDVIEESANQAKEQAKRPHRVGPVAK